MKGKKIHTFIVASTQQRKSTTTTTKIKQNSIKMHRGLFKNAHIFKPKFLLSDTVMLSPRTTAQVRHLQTLVPSCGLAKYHTVCRLHSEVQKL